MNLLSRFICTSPFSFAVGLSLGVLALYVVERSKESKRLEETYREIEALVRALEAKIQKGEQVSA